MRRKRESGGQGPEICSLRGGRVYINGRPSNISPFLAALVLLKDGVYPTENYGRIHQTASRTLLRMASFLAARKTLGQAKKGEEA